MDDEESIERILDFCEWLEGVPDPEDVLAAAGERAAVVGDPFGSGMCHAAARFIAARSRILKEL